MSASRAGPSGGTGFWERFLRNRLAVGAGGVLIVILSFLLAASLLSLGDPAAISLGDRLLPPLSEDHVLGTDHLGRDILLRLLDGARISFAVAVAATVLAAFVGTLIGLVAGYAPGWLDTTLMRGIDVMMAFPYLLLALAIVAVLGPGLMNALLAVAVVNVPFFARIIRGHTVAETGRDYVAAARLSGFSGSRILFTEVFPNVLPAVIITMASTVGWMILETAGLSFLGLGAQPPQADLGSMLGEGRKVIFLAPHVGTIPGLAIIALVVSLNLVADGLRDGLDPRLRTGKLARPSAATEVMAAPAESREAADAPLLAVNNLRTWFMTGRTPMKAVDDLSFTLDKGESLGLLGESGSGKSVTALSLLKLVPSPPGVIVGGSVRYHGRDLLAMPYAALQRIRGGRIGYVFQDAATALNPLLTAGEQITESLRRHQGLSPRDAHDKALDLMEMVHLPRPKTHIDQYPHELSGGMRQRVMLAAALANDIDLLIADEPTTALDVTTQAAILELLRELQARHGFALLFITHDLSVLSKVAETAIVMRRGRAVERGAVTDLLTAPQNAYTQELVASIPRLGAPRWLTDKEAEA